MKNKVLSWTLFILSIIGIFCSIPLIIRGSKPCSSDGCLIRFLAIGGILILIPSLCTGGYILWKSIKRKIKWDYGWALFWHNCCWDGLHSDGKNKNSKFRVYSNLSQLIATKHIINSDLWHLRQCLSIFIMSLNLWGFAFEQKKVKQNQKILLSA